jgi:antitoxin YefM
MESVPPNTWTESGPTPALTESSSSRVACAPDPASFPPTVGYWGERQSSLSRASSAFTPIQLDMDITLDRRHNCGVTTQPLREVRDHLSEVVDRVEHHHDRVVVTRNGHPAAVILSPDDLAELEETIEVLSDNAALADIREADEAYARGDVVRGVDAVRRLRR